jgi:HEAT repeat protein
MDAAYRHRRSRWIGRRGRALVVVAFTLVAMVAPTASRAEDRVAALTRMLASSSDKTRLSAVLALAKLGEPRVEKPLIHALHDPSPRVRGVAAVALGRLASEAALSTLRGLARDDADPDVRKAADTAAMKIGAAHPADSAAHPADRAARAEGEMARRPPPGGERHASYSVEPHPDLYVLVNSAADESPGAADAATRRLHAGIIKRTLLEQLRSDASITSVASEAQRWSLEARHVDLSVTRLAATRAGPLVEIAAELRIAISDDSGRMLSILSGGAKVQIPADKFDARYLPTLRKDALDNAMRGMVGKLVTQLRDSPDVSSAAR